MRTHELDSRTGGVDSADSSAVVEVEAGSGMTGSVCGGLLRVSVGWWVDVDIGLFDVSLSERAEVDIDWADWTEAAAVNGSAMLLVPKRAIAVVSVVAVPELDARGGAG